MLEHKFHGNCLKLIVKTINHDPLFFFQLSFKTTRSTFKYFDNASSTTLFSM